MNETNEKTPLTPEQVAAKNREVAMYYKIVCTLSRNLHCSPNRAMQLLECPAPSESRYPPGSPMRRKRAVDILA